MTTTTDPRDREILNLRTENRALQDRFSLLARLSRQVTGSLDVASVLQTVVDAACELTSARYGALGVFDSAGVLQRFITHGISDAERERIGHLPVGLGLLGWLHHSQETLRVANIADHPQSVGFPANHPAMKSFMGAPLRFGGESLGNLYLTEKQGTGEFSPQDETLLILFASQASLAIHNARVLEQVKADSAALFIEQERLRALIQTCPIAVFMVDAPTKTLLVVNREGLRLTGAALKAGDSLASLAAAEHAIRQDKTEYAEEELPIARALRGERVAAEEMRFQHADGQTVPVLASASPVFSPEGEVVAAVSMLQDTTPIEELERLRSEFLGMVSHELKTPLTAIKGSSATYLGSKRPFNSEETRELFEIIEEQSDRLRDLVDNLLDMTRIEAGRLTVNPETEDLRALLDEVKSTFLMSAGDHELNVSYANDSVTSVKGDRRRIIQVISNLLNNAAKFSPVGSPISIAVAKDSLTHVRVSVQDHGRGIPRDRQPLLFRKFSQVSDDSKSRSMGTGLGLAICKGIVEAHGGRIWVESEGEGQGSTFAFTLPIAEEISVPAATPRQADPTKRADHQGKVHRGGERTKVLAVDDEAQILRYLQRTLDDAGYHAVLTSDPDQVSKLVEMEEPDLVLLDVNLPGSSGFDLLARIREISGVPVIFLTASTSSEDMVKALKMGADDYIAKPFSPSELLARIEAVLRRRVMADTLEVRPLFLLGDLSIHFGERQVTVAGAPVALTATEYKLLFELANHAGIVLTHDQILQRVWGEEYSGATELLRSVVRNLRRKLGDDARHPRYVLTETQVGYRMPKPTA